MKTLPKDVEKRFGEKLKNRDFGRIEYVNVGEVKQFLAEELEKATCDHDWHVPDFGDDVDNEQFATCKKCNAWKE